jgi:hypothetical protein
MSVYKQLVLLAHGTSMAESFHGYCSSCGRGMFKQKKPPKEDVGWILASCATECVTCAGRRKRGTPEERTRDLVMSCVGCKCRLRGKNDDPVPGTKLRHTRDMCKTCSTKRYTESKMSAGCAFTHCTVCSAEFGSTGPKGGVVRVKVVGKGICNSCAQRLVERRKKERAAERVAGSRPLVKFM